MRKNAKQYIALKCAKCGDSFDKELKEYNRRTKDGQTKFYCGYGCSYPAINQPDEFASFRQIYFAAEKVAKEKKRDFNISLEFLKKLWEKQGGKCAYTGVQMTLPRVMREVNHSVYAASLDRIDANEGYTKDNVEFVCRFVNLGKNNYPKLEVQDFFKAIKMVALP